jgi:hypothetical protein
MAVFNICGLVSGVNSWCAARVVIRSERVRFGDGVITARFRCPPREASRPGAVPRGVRRATPGMRKRRRRRLLNRQTGA